MFVMRGVLPSNPARQSIMMAYFKKTLNEFVLNLLPGFSESRQGQHLGKSFQSAVHTLLLAN